MPGQSSWISAKLRAALAIGLLTVSAGCGSDLRGTAVPGATEVDAALLRTGPFQTEPVSYELKPDIRGPERIRLIEGRRLLNFLIHPMDIDSDLIVPSKTHIFGDQDSVPNVGGLNDEQTKIFKDSPEFVTGVAAGQSNGSVRSPKTIEIAILRFISESKSSEVASELDRIAMASTPRHRIDIPGHPTARSSSIDNKSIDSWRPHGTYLVMVSVKNAAQGIDQLTASAKKALEMQTRSIDKQSPVPLDDVLDQPLDPENIVRRTMDHDPRDSSSSEEDYGIFQSSGMLHFERNPVEARRKFEETGVDLIGRRASTVYRTKDLASAFLLQTFLARQGKDDVTLAPPPGIADAQCLRLDPRDPSRNYDLMCAVVFDRYVAVVTESSTNTTAQVDHSLQERTAAQYAILKKCG
ncbi:DUF7373 family lipoprotein [Nocardia sp. NPDC055029]